MKYLSRILFAVAAIAVSSWSQAEGTMHIEDAWARPLPPVAPNGAAYFTIHNAGVDDRLVGIESPVAEQAQMHVHVHQNGVMKMRHVPQMLFPAESTTTLKPGGHHVMLLKLRKPLETGAKFTVTLMFEKAGRVDVPVVVGPEPGEASGANEHQMHDKQAKAGAKGEHGGHGSHNEKTGAASGHQSGHGGHDKKASGSGHAGHQGHAASAGHDHSKTIDVPAAEAPRLTLSGELHGSGMVNLKINVSKFRFSFDSVDKPHVAGVGHAHLYINGTKIGRVFEATHTLDGLAPGVHEILVSLHANTHEGYAVDGRPVMARLILAIPDGDIGDVKTSIANLMIVDGALPKAAKTIRAKQNEIIELRWKSDSVRHLHLHGYDIEAEVGPHRPVSMMFFGAVAGRFPIEVHGKGAH
ncbi:MAG: copper chaperone PCu(A)C, partial [Gammaproteobacteria bacterium]|nr:copper chaperone PCu(A)C [Gammaproteobacteria bacterium]